MLANRVCAAGACAALVAAVPVVGGAAPPAVGQWRPLLEVPAIVDVVGPRTDGRLVLSAREGLFLLRPGEPAEPVARGPDGYVPAGGEPYIALAPSRRLAARKCSFHRDDVFALDADSTPGVVRITTSGKAARLVDLPTNGMPSGIAFDTVGRFGYRLLVTTVADTKTTLYAVDCLGGVATVVRDAPQVEGGMVVAPRMFGSFGGDLIAPDERSGRILAFEPGGRVRLVVASNIRAGGDIGVEGLGFVPRGPAPPAAAYYSDLGAPGSPTEGTDSLLVLRGQDLAKAGLRPGELVAATEAGATTVAVRCAKRCTVRHVADGPVATHGEGHLTFVPGA